MVHYLEFPTELYQRIGRIVSDTEAQKTSSTYFDIRHSAKAERLPKRRLLVMTGGSFANDRCSTFPTMDEWMAKLILTIFDEAQHSTTPDGHKSQDTNAKATKHSRVVGGPPD